MSIQVIITCEDLARAGVRLSSGCCGSCHEDADEGYVDLSTIYPPEKRPTRKPWNGPVSAVLCCRVLGRDFSMTRNDWARVLRLKRKAEQGAGLLKQFEKASAEVKTWPEWMRRMVDA